MPALSTEMIARTVPSGYDLACGVREVGFRRIHLAGPLDIATIIELGPAIRTAEMEVVSLDAGVCSGRIFGDPDLPLSLAAAQPPCGLPGRRALAMVMSRAGHRVGCWRDPETEAALARLGLGSRSPFTGRFADRLLGEFIPVRPGESGCRSRAHSRHERPRPVPVIRPAANLSGAGLRAVARQSSRPAA